MNQNLVQLGRKRASEKDFEAFTDPVCQMLVRPDSAAGKFSYQNKTYYFCALKCRDRFRQNPANYLDPAQKPEEASDHGEIGYTCPMHPEIAQAGFGMCPLCGMALEPKTFTLEEDNSEQEDMERRLWFSLIFTLPVFVLAMSEMFIHLPGWAPWLQFLLATPVVFYFGSPFFERAWASLAHKSPNMFTLIAAGVSVAWGYSLVALAFPGLFPHSFAGHGGNPAVYFEASAVITALVLLGQVLELRARRKTTSALRELLGLAPKAAHVVFIDGEEADIPLEDVQKGAMLRVKANEKIPVDGFVVEGEGPVDESMVTGESIPALKQPGGSLTGGTVNGSNSFLMKASRIGQETLLAQIVRMVSEAQRSRSAIQGLADKVSAYFVPAVVLVSIASFLVWALLGNPLFGLACGVSVLIIACPCALGLATPMSIMTGTGRGARAGILVKNASALEMLEKAELLVFDKTGTLTEGKPKLQQIVSFSGEAEEELLRYAASLERNSEHPIAGAILEAAKERGIALENPANFEAVAGSGIMGDIGGGTFRIGTEAFAREGCGESPENEELIESLRESGQTALYLSRGKDLIGGFGVSDSIKENAAEAISMIHSLGIKTMMLTGDNSKTAKAIAGKLGIPDFRAEAKPQDKAAIIKQIQQSGKIVAMAGDGVNDAPALAQADIGIAMATGTDIAIESAGITLLKGDLSGILRAINLSRATMKNIRQNLFFAFGYNLLGVPLAAGILYPFFGILLSPMIASAAMAFSSVSVIANALRLRHARL